MRIQKRQQIFAVILDNPGLTANQIGKQIGLSGYEVKGLLQGEDVTYVPGKPGQYYWDEGDL